MSSQPQLFENFGVVRIGPKKKRRNAEAQKRKTAARISRLVGKGWLRQDPRTGNWYEVHGTTSLMRAWPVSCACGCGEILYRSKKHLRKTRGKAWCSGSQPTRAVPIGSRRQVRGGYIQIKTLVRGWIQEHRFVMEQALGRDLGPAESVHHINGWRADNRLSNLQLRRAHGAGQAHQCLDCGSSNIIAIPLAG